MNHIIDLTLLLIGESCWWTISW